MKIMPIPNRHLLLIGRNAIFTLYIFRYQLYLMGLYAFSRVQIFGTCAAAIFARVYCIWHLLFCSWKTHSRHTEKSHSLAHKIKKFSFTLFFSDFFSLGISFYLINYFKRGSFELTTDYEKLLLVVFAVWLSASLFTRKFEKKPYRNVYYAISPHVKTIIIMVATMAVIVFAFRFFYYSRLQIFGAFTLLLFLEIGFTYLSFIIEQK